VFQGQALPIAVLVSCKTYEGPTLWHTEPRPDFLTGIPIVPMTPLETTFEMNGKTPRELNCPQDSIILGLPPPSLGSYRPQITRLYTGQNQAGAGKEGVFDWFDICGPFAGEAQ
jgi:hypothetical protein